MLKLFLDVVQVAFNLFLEVAYVNCIRRIYIYKLIYMVPLKGRRRSPSGPVTAVQFPTRSSWPQCAARCIHSVTATFADIIRYKLVLFLHISLRFTTKFRYRVNLKKCSNTRITISQKCVNIFLRNSVHLFTRQLRKKCAALWYIYLTFAKLTETQTSGTNFATAQKVDVIEVSLIERPVPPLLRRQCDAIILFKFRMLINVLIF